MKKNLYHLGGSFLYNDAVQFMYVDIYVDIYVAG